MVMQGWRFTPANNRWSTINDEFFWNFGDAYSREFAITSAEEGIPQLELNSEQQAQMFKTLSLQHPEDLDFCCDAAELLDSIVGYSGDAATIREASLQTWKPERTTALRNRVQAIGGGYFIDSAVRMAFGLVRYFSAIGQHEKAAQYTRQAARMLFCDASKGPRTKESETAQNAANARELVKDLQSYCTQYGVQFSSNTDEARI